MATATQVVFFLEPDELEGNQRLALSRAIHAGDVATVRSLLRDQTLLSAPVTQGLRLSPPLIDAILAGHACIFEELLERSTDLEAVDVDEGGTAVYWAAGGGYLDALEHLLDRGANIAARSYDGFTALHSAARTGRRCTSALLIARGLPADVVAGSSQLTPLHLAAAGGHVAVVVLLLERAAAVDTADAEGATPLLHAARGGHARVAELLLERGASPAVADASSLRTSLHWAAVHGHPRMAELLLRDSRVNPNAADARGETPLLLAARKGFCSVIELLLQAEAQVDAGNAEGVTPLLNSAFFGHTAAVRLLLGRGADIRAKDLGSGRTAMHWAAMNDHAYVVELLLEHSPILELADRLGLTALDVALEAGADEAVALLSSRRL